MKVLVIDNYDSFVYNLVQYVRAQGMEVVVRRNTVGIKELESTDPDGLIISPGPGRPEAAGVSGEAVRVFSMKIPILGVCLGHQVIGHVFGARIGYAQRIMHGKVSVIQHDAKGIFEGIKNPFHATRYHSLIVCEADLPSCLHISARSEDGEVMGVRHSTLPVEGVQFHPESILTEDGRKLIENFLKF
ncbi:MAG: aminodeoxychorismate/anthranilate synthase component II [Methanophagales archaeon ANME-1-THS]|nr:MAG: aminodeoxychorismate/anthranilate synthase component II [Methanophagales archaeon ANME-1-THS]